MNLSKNIACALISFAALVMGIAIGYAIFNGPPQKQIVYKEKQVSGSSQCPNPYMEKSKTDYTAKEAYDAALFEARNWNKDAYLFEIALNSKIFNDDGSSNGWIFRFYSREAGKSYEILIKDGESRGGEEEPSKQLQTLKGEMVDTSELAKSFYAIYPNDSKIINLKMYYSENDKRFIWTLFFEGGSHTINAET